MGGAVEAIVDIGGDLISAAADVSSVVTDLGAEFLASDIGAAALSFGVPGADVFSSFGGFDLVGSFAGDASWFDAFNPGSILDSIPSVGDFNLGSITDSLPSLSSIKDIASTVSGDIGGIVKTAQTGIAAYNKVAPAVNAVSSALGIQNPINQIIQPLNQAVGIAGSAAGIAGSVSGGISSLSKLNTNNLVSSGAAALGINPSTVSSVNRVLNTNLVANDPISTIARDVATGLPINTARAVDQFGLGILTDQESTALTKKATLINSLIDPQAPTVDNYSEAIASRNELLTSKQEFETAISGLEREIANSNKNIEEMQANLQDPDLSDRQRELLEAQIKANQDTIALNVDNLLSSQATLDDINSNLESDQAIITTTNNSAISAPSAINRESVPGGTRSQYEFVKNTADGTYSIIDTATGDTVQSGLTQQQALLAEQDLNIATPGISTTSGPIAVSIPTITIPGINPNTAQQAAAQQAGTNIQNLVAQARQQQAIRNQKQSAAQSTDWRIRLRLAPNSNYLYNSEQPGVLAPLSSRNGTDGVIFPYTPAIDTAYKANYDSYDLTHSNYRGYFYKNSYVDAINVRAQFTAQDTNEADYLMAVIHFFRSATKMFYGQDAQRGSPPPLVYLSGYGVSQFSEHPCLIGQFNYSLPPDVDYIRAGTTLSNGTNLLPNRTRQPNPSNPLSYSITRLLNNGLTQGAQDNRPSQINGLDINSVSYVPTKMEISITLLPTQSRSQVSKQFSLQGFANGNLLRAGYW